MVARQWTSTSIEYLQIKQLRSLTENENGILKFGEFPGRISRHQRLGQMRDEVRYEWEQEALQKGVFTHPACELSFYLAGNPYYVKRYFYPIKGKLDRKVVHFIASATSQAGEILSTRDFNAWKRENTWFGISTCIEGQITHLEAADGRYSGINGQSARQCGFGSILAYLCFRNIEHMPFTDHTFQTRNTPPTQGYDIVNDRHWAQGNMPELRQGLVFEHCRSIIYVQYRAVTTTSTDTRRGNKAFIYAAIAARYRHLITYNPNPCTRDCCIYEGPGASQQGASQHLGTGWFRGKIFWLQGILDDFNVRNPPHLIPSSGLTSNNTQPLGNEKMFAEHHGNHWYFCSGSFIL